MQMQITGLKEVREMLARLPKNIREEVGQKGVYSLAQNLQRRMKRRVPKDTGWLRRSIMVVKTDKGARVEVNAQYAMAIEEGSKPHKIPEAYLGQHKTMPDAPGQYISDYRGPWVIVSGKAIKFTENSLRSIKPQIPKLLKQYVEKALGEAR